MELVVDEWSINHVPTIPPRGNEVLIRPDQPIMVVKLIPQAPAIPWVKRGIGIRYPKIPMGNRKLST